jgi:hypothetical protein
MIGPIGYFLIVCILLVAVATCLIGYNMTGVVAFDDSVEAICRTRVNGAINAACKTYFERNGRYPNNLKELLVKNGNGGPYVESPDAIIDQWGQPFQYDAKGPMNFGERPDIWTVQPKSGRVIANWPNGR